MGYPLGFLVIIWRDFCTFCLLCRQTASDRNSPLKVNVCLVSFDSCFLVVGSMAFPCLMKPTIVLAATRAYDRVASVYARSSKTICDEPTTLAPNRKLDYLLLAVLGKGESFSCHCCCKSIRSRNQHVRDILLSVSSDPPDKYLPPLPPKNRRDSFLLPQERRKRR